MQNLLHVQPRENRDLFTGVVLRPLVRAVEKGNASQCPISLRGTSAMQHHCHIASASLRLPHPTGVATAAALHDLSYLLSVEQGHRPPSFTQRPICSFAHLFTLTSLHVPKKKRHASWKFQPHCCHFQCRFGTYTAS